MRWMTAELAARVSSSAEYGGVEVEYIDPGRGQERRLPRRCLARSLRAHSASHRIAS
jgi:hypothetical protein